MPRDDWQSAAEALNAPGGRWLKITPSDTDDLPAIPKYLIVGETGGLFDAVGNDDVVCPFFAVAGQKIDIRPKRINNTNTAVGIDLMAIY